jgi:hypothetical protein
VSGSGLLALSNGVRDYFAAQDLDVLVGPVGRRTRENWIDQAPSGAANRVLFMQPKGDRGRIIRGHQTFNPDSIAYWERPVVVSMWGADPSQPDDEEAQIEAAENLFELTMQAIRRAVDPLTKRAINLSNLEFGNLREVDDQKDNYVGVELQLSIVLKGPIFDVTLETTAPKASMLRPPTMAGPVAARSLP